MPSYHDGPKSPLFTPLHIKGNVALHDLSKQNVSEAMKTNAAHAPTGSCTGWGIPFEIERVVLIDRKPVQVDVKPFTTRWLVFMHTADTADLEWNKDGFISPTRGVGRLAEHVADYVLCYADGSEERVEILRRHQLGMFTRGWGENCFQAVAHRKPYPIRSSTRQPTAGWPWGWSQTQAAVPDMGPWVNWLWAWENPKPTKQIKSIRFEPKTGVIIISAVSATNVAQCPLRWERREKAILRLPKGAEFNPDLDANGLLEQVQLDLGQVISAQPRTVYPNDDWAQTYNNKVPEVAASELLVEYSAHSGARFHLANDKTVRVTSLAEGRRAVPLTPIAPARQRVQIRVLDQETKKPVAVKLHVHGEAGEYLAPATRHRIPNSDWFEDYAPEFQNRGVHRTAYIPGETLIDLPLGRVYIEVSKGFEIKPVRKVVEVSPRTKQITIPIAKVLPWREHGWVTADTHVHFLSPHTALLEGAAEGVNVVNLLASQWGELMTNVGDFDAQTNTLGSREAGGDGEYLVRVGTENRQHVLGHISLLGYRGRVIAPMTTAGPDESAIGDPVDVLLTEWARQCHKQGGLVVLPHFPNPRAEHAAAVVHGDIDAVEMTCWENLYAGIDPYSLSDWYRYLNCGYFVPAVAGTDKMAATTAVGTVRTYARIPAGRSFEYDAWMEAVRSGDTFVTYGPLMEFAVEGKPAGSRIAMKRTGGTVDVTWQAASVTVPMSRVDVVVNGEIRDSRRVKPKEDAGYCTLKIDRSSWIALLIRGHYPDKPEIVAAHSSPVVVRVEGLEFFAAADAVTILDQIEGAMAYIDTLGTRADAQTYKRMRLVLTAAHRKLHNQLHELGHDHRHVVGPRN